MRIGFVRLHWFAALFMLLALPCVCLANAAADKPHAEQSLSFTVTYDESITDSYTGRVYIMLSTSTAGEPRMGPRWSNTEPFFAVDVTDWKPSSELYFDSSDTTLAFPAALRELSQDDYAIQAVMRRNLDSPTIGSGEGTAYSTNQTKNLTGTASGNVTLHITEIAKARDWAKHPLIKRLTVADRFVHVRVRSDLLSAFHGRDMYLEAAVLLPKSYADEANSTRTYPALYIIPGFGGDEYQSMFMAMGNRDELADNIIKIGLDASCRTGHHVFANSANNGPWGDALVEELVPHLEATFRLASAAHGRFLTGISSGGWSSLWLQISYPEFFGGTWSFVPDPVDFRKFQTVNIYRDGENMYQNANGDPRPLGRYGSHVFIWSQPFARMEVVMGEGGQLSSFEAVFSPKGDDGKPLPLYNRETGDIDPAVAEAWKNYDIRLVLEKNWPNIGETLAGKLRVIAGEDDNFYLEDAVKLLGQTLIRLGSDAVVEVLEDRDHGSTASPDQFQRVDRELLEVFDTGQAKQANHQ